MTQAPNLQVRELLSRAMLDKCIPHKAHFTLGEVCELCQVRPDVLRAWENQFSQLRSERRKTNRRFFSREETILVYRIAYLIQRQGMSTYAARAWLDTHPLEEELLSTAPTSSYTLGLFSISTEKSTHIPPPQKTVSTLPTIPTNLSPKQTLPDQEIRTILVDILSILNGKK